MLCISPGKRLTQEVPRLGSFSILLLLANSFLTLLITANTRDRSVAPGDFSV